jgi:hypothetical protein
MRTPTDDLPPLDPEGERLALVAAGRRWRVAFDWIPDGPFTGQPHLRIVRFHFTDEGVWALCSGHLYLRGIGRSRGA